MSKAHTVNTTTHTWSPWSELHSCSNGTDVHSLNQHPVFISIQLKYVWYLGSTYQVLSTYPVYSHHKLYYKKYVKVLGKWPVIHPETSRWFLHYSQCTTIQPALHNLAPRTQPIIIDVREINCLHKWMDAWMNGLVSIQSNLLYDVFSQTRRTYCHSALAVCLKTIPLWSMRYFAWSFL